MTKRKRVGSWVRLKVRVRRGPQKAQIIEQRPLFARGAVVVSPALDGFRWWNKADLIVCDPPKAAR